MSKVLLTVILPYMRSGYVNKYLDDGWVIKEIIHNVISSANMD